MGLLWVIVKIFICVGLFREWYLLGVTIDDEFVCKNVGGCVLRMR